MATAAVKPQTGAENIRWNLGDLYASPDDLQIEQDMQIGRERAEAFAKEYRGRVAGLDPEEMRAALEETDDLNGLFTKIYYFPYLAWTTDTQNTTWGKLMTKTQQYLNEMNQIMLFFEIEWANAPEEAARKLIEHPVLGHYQHFLEVARLYQPYTLTEPEEKIMSELSLSAGRGWNRYFNEVMANLRYPLDGEELTQAEILKKLKDADREVRRRAADSLTTVLRQNMHTTAFVFNMILQEKASHDKLRGYETWISSRNLSNQVDDQTVEALISAVTSRYDLVERYYNLLKKLLGYDELYDYDRYAPFEIKSSHIEWEQGREIVLTAFRDFNPQMAEIADMFFLNNWIDAAVVPGKRGGAYSAGGPAKIHPFIFTNYLGDNDSVMTLAHELGHGIHQYLSRVQGDLMNSTPLTTAEMASTFGEMLVFDYLIAQEDDPEVRLSMRLDKIVDTFGTVYRQISMNRFEHAIHTHRREKGELSADELSQYWLETQKKMYGDSVILRDDYSAWWSYVPHFLGTPGYVYAYAFGELLVWALYARYQQAADKKAFAAAYLKALEAGGSGWPHDILAPLNVDLRDPDFWHEGLGLIEKFIEQTEQDAAQA